MQISYTAKVGTGFFGGSEILFDISTSGLLFMIEKLATYIILYNIL